jgi:hypothetical protein
MANQMETYPDNIHKSIQGDDRRICEQIIMKNVTVFRGETDAPDAIDAIDKTSDGRVMFISTCAHGYFVRMDDFNIIGDEDEGVADYEALGWVSPFPEEVEKKEVEDEKKEKDDALKPRLHIIVRKLLGEMFPDNCCVPTDDNSESALVDIIGHLVFQHFPDKNKQK